MTRDELEQRLWELEYGLLSDEDAASLRAQIDSDSEIAELYQRVRAQSSVVAKAARIDAPPIKFRIPPAAATSQSVTHAHTPYSGRIRRLANWSLSLSASLLIALLAWTAWPTSKPVAIVANQSTDSEPVALLIKAITPARISPETSSQIEIVALSDEKPKKVALKALAENERGDNIFSKDFTTDDLGRAYLELPSQVAVVATKLNLRYAENAATQLQVDLTAAENRYTTYVATDKPNYRPGDVVRFRSVTLSRFGLKADQNLPLEFSITDPEGKEVTGSNLNGTTQHGVGNVEIALQPEAAPGRYTVFARNATHTFPDAKRDFIVSKEKTRQYDIEMHWEDEPFAGGSTALGEIAVRTPTGEPAAEVKLGLRAFVDGHPIDLAAEVVPTDRDGKATVSLGLPAQISSTDGDLAIRVGDQEETWRDIPLHANHLFVDFYPEGGDLVAGVESRVYFHAHDFDGNPVAIQGRVLDGNQREVAAAATQHEGRGVVRLTPAANESYVLAIDDPKGIESRSALPVATDQRRLVLNAEPGVYEAGESIKVRLRSQSPPSTFGVVAYCRGVQAGQTSGSAADFRNAECDVTLPLIADASGVLRVTVFDYSKPVYEPLAERLVFRKPARKLNVQIDGLLPKYSAGAEVNGELFATDETGKPISAMFGMSVVDTSALQTRGPAIPRMPAHFLLLGDLDRPDRLEDANFYLVEGEPSQIALDLLLGTEGWRRFELGLGAKDGLAYGTAGMSAGLGAGGGVDRHLVEFDAMRESQVRIEDEAPRSFDNSAEVEAQKLETLANEALVPVQNPQPEVTREFPITACVGLVAVILASIVIRSRPNSRSLIQTLLVLGVLATMVTAYHWSMWWNARSMPETASSPTAEAAPMAGSVLYSEAAKEAPMSAEPAGAVAATLEKGLAASNEPEGLPARAKAPEMATESTRTSRGLGQLPAAPLEPAPAAALAPAAAPAPAPRAPAAMPPAAPAPSASFPPPKPAPDAPDLPRSPVPEAPAPTQVESGLKGAAGFGGAGAPDRRAGTAMERPSTGKPPTDPTKRDQSSSESRSRNAVPPNQTLMRKDNRLELQQRQNSATTEEKVSEDKPVANTPSPTGGGKEKADLQDAFGARVTELTADKKTSPDAASKKEALDDYFLFRRYAYPIKSKRGGTKPNDFTESIYWHPLLITDEMGRASFDFGLPDTVTQFRILAEGHSDGRLGDAEQIISTEP